MSKDQNVFARAEEFLNLFKRGAEFTRDLLKENERLRLELMRVNDLQEMAAQSPEQWTKLRHELLTRIHSLEEECTTVRERLDRAQEENREFAARYVEIEEENNHLANLYVASYQLHSTVDLEEVFKIITEIAINLIGAEVFAIYTMDEATGELTPVAAEGAAVSAFRPFAVGSGVLGRAVAANEATCWDATRSDDLSQPIVCVPLVVRDRPIGAIAVFSLLQQKEGFTALDHELFNMLAGHAATAVFAAKLYSQSARKSSTIQGFIDLLAR